jgi:hypothetical protein
MRVSRYLTSPPYHCDFRHLESRLEFVIALLLSLTLLTPQQAWERETVCWRGSCHPRVVCLGEWDPRPAEADWPTTAPAPEEPAVYSWHPGF